MGFALKDWDELTQRLIRLTTEGKLQWVESNQSNETSHFLRMTTALSDPEYSASVGSNLFQLGSADRDGRAPYYLDVSRTANTSAMVKDRIRSDSLLSDPAYRRVSMNVSDLWALVQSYMEIKNEAAKDIIADLDRL